MTNYPNKGDKVVFNKADSPPREVVKVDPADDLIEIRSSDGGFGSHVRLKTFEADYTKVE